jgi:hypothetical protein
MSEKEFELREFSEHEIRNLVAEELKNLLSSGAPLELVQKLAGVPGVETTEVYKKDSEQEEHWFFEKQEQLLELIQEKLQKLNGFQQELVLQFIEKLEVNH